MLRRIHVAITTYRRREMIKELIEEINKAALEHDITVSVYDDDPDSSIPDWISIFDPCRVRWQINTRRRGKQEFWKTINDIILDASVREWDFFFLLQDDLTLEPGFFNKMIDIWENIDDLNKICLNPLLDESRKGVPNWTGIYPEEYTGRNGQQVYKVGWVDCIFMCDRKMLSDLRWRIYPISPDRWKQDMNLSSGVGQQISTRLLAMGGQPYQVFTSLAHHGDHPSMMNIGERNKTPLIG